MNNPMNLNAVINAHTHQNQLAHTSAPSDIIKHFHTPITTGTSVLGLAFQGGVIVCADILGSYGSLARFKNCPRIFKVNELCLIGVGGDYADFQYLRDMIQAKVIGEESMEEGSPLKPASLHSWLTRVLYGRRSKFDPLWNNVIIAGMQNGQPFMAAVDKLGTAFEDKYIATGYGAYIAVPLLRDALTCNPTMDKDQAISVITKCMEVLYYRDARSLNKYQIGVVTKEGCEIIGPVEVKADWGISSLIHGYD